jgi:hypothetical protein
MDAVNICSAAGGGRLCSATELQSRCTDATGCGHNSDLVWSSTPCTPVPPSVSVNQSQTFTANMPFPVMFAGATNMTDYVAVFPHGPTSSYTPSGRHTYAYHSQQTGAGTVMITIATNGTYDIMLMCCDGYTLISNVVTVTVQGVTPQPTVTVATNPTNGGYTYQAGFNISVAFSGATQATDWIGVYRAGSAHTSSTYYSFTYHGSVTGSGSVDININEAGAYDVMMFCCDGYTQVSQAQRITITGQTTPAVITNVTAGPYYVNDTITLSYSNAQHPGDLVGIYRTGTAYAQSGFHISRTIPSAGSGQVTVQISESGQFDVAMFCCNGLTLTSSASAPMVLNINLHVQGCTITTAANYNPLATQNDGSCFYTCPAGQYGAPPTVACAPYTTCTLNSTYQTTAPTSTSDRACSPVSSCLLGYQYQQMPPTLLTDRQCVPVGTCLATEYETHAPTLTSNRMCVPLTVCDNATQYERTPPTLTSNRDCGPNSEVTGCTNSSATNYDSNMIYSDNSCIFPNVYGCMNSTATNYNPAATADDPQYNAPCVYPTFDCARVLNGNATLDQCGTCDADPTNDCVQDCSGTWGGTAVLDHCQVCGGDNTTCISQPYTTIYPTLRAVLVGNGTGNVDHLAYQTYRIYVDLPVPNMTVYALYGDDTHTVFVPRAIQHPDHDPTNVGGPTAAALSNNALQQFFNGAEDLNIADSWLTLGLDNGDPQGVLTTTTAMTVELSGGWVKTTDPNQACVCPTNTPTTATTCTGTVTNSLGNQVTGQPCHYEQAWGEDHVLVDADYGFNGGMLFSTPSTYSARDTGNGVLIMQLALEAGDQHVKFNLQGEYPSVPANHASGLGGQSCAFPSVAAGGRNPALAEPCTWKAFEVQLNFTSTPPAPCPYDAMPKPNAAGVCTSAYGCPDGLINVQDLQEMLSKMATCRLDCSLSCSTGPSTCTANSCNQAMASGQLRPGCTWHDTFIGYPLDAHPAPGCRAGNPPVCQAGYGNGLLNVHDLLGLLAVYASNYNIYPCAAMTGTG